MDDTVKLIIEIDECLYERIKYYEPNGNTMAATALHSIANGIPLDDVKTEFINSYPTNDIGKLVSDGSMFWFSLNKVLQILDNIGKAESEDK